MLINLKEAAENGRTPGTSFNLNISAIIDAGLDLAPESRELLV